MKFNGKFTLAVIIAVCLVIFAMSAMARKDSDLRAAKAAAMGLATDGHSVSSLDFNLAVTQPKLISREVKVVPSPADETEFDQTLTITVTKIYEAHTLAGK